VSEWVFGTGSLSATDVLKIYNHGYISDIPYSASNIIANWSFGNTGSFGTDNITKPGGQFFNQLTERYFITSSNAITNYSPGVFTITSTAPDATANLKTMKVATFGLTASSEDGDFNGTPSATGGKVYVNMTAHSNPFFTFAALSGGVTPVSGDVRTARDNVIEIQRDDLTSSDSIIVTRFSAPGGPEINTRGYLDIGSQEFSAYNALPFRNLTIRGSGSGEATTIRANSQASRREGLQTHLRRHSGRFGVDSVYGYVTNTYIVGDASFEKTNRNTRVVVETNSLVITDTFDNGNTTRPVPSQDYGYSWVTASLGEAMSVRTAKQQLAFGYWPVDGILSASADVNWRNNGFDSAVQFPTASFGNGLVGVYS
jgi:hypothetical protein